uniref:Cysteine-rich protein 1 n=1 Tax=Astyanax mexicanus TaxID=7994 RepID=W5LAC8_ASTMX
MGSCGQCVGDKVRSVGLARGLQPTSGKKYWGEKKRSLGRDYHPLCLKCHKCKRQLTPGQHAEHDEKPYCTNCYMRDFGPRGSRGPVSRTCNTAAS